MSERERERVCERERESRDGALTDKVNVREEKSLFFYLSNVSSTS